MTMMTLTLTPSELCSIVVLSLPPAILSFLAYLVVPFFVVSVGWGFLGCLLYSFCS